MKKISCLGVIGFALLFVPTAYACTLSPSTQAQIASLQTQMSNEQASYEANLNSIQLNYQNEIAQAQADTQSKLAYFDKTTTIPAPPPVGNPDFAKIELIITQDNNARKEIQATGQAIVDNINGEESDDEQSATVSYNGSQAAETQQLLALEADCEMTAMPTPTVAPTPTTQVIIPNSIVPVVTVKTPTVQTVAAQTGQPVAGVSVSTSPQVPVAIVPTVRDNWFIRFMNFLKRLF